MNDPEVMPPEGALVKAEAHAVAPTNLFGSTDAVGVVAKATAVASALKDVIRSQGLISKISGKEYPRCEAWTLLGTMLGVYPVLVWSRKAESGDGWEARVEARTRDGAIVGAAEAECLRAERNWKDRDDFALRSMSQTRATAKALRMPLGFVMTLAGYEPTPAEEMVGETPERHQSAPPSRPDASRERFDDAPATKTQQKQENAPAGRTEAPKHATDATRQWMLKGLQARPGDPNRAITQEFFVKSGVLLETEELESMPLRYVPITTDQLKLLVEAVRAFELGEEAKFPYVANDAPPAAEAKPKPPTPKSTRPVDAGDDEDADDAPWRSFPVPFGRHAGIKLAELDKKILFGFWANYEVETEYNGKPKKPDTIAKDQMFRDMLDDAGEHYGFETKGQKP